MENMSILSFFNSSNITVTPQSKTGEGMAGFEDIFKKYLDRSAPAAQDGSASDKRDVSAEEPESPEEVIENLDIPKDQKEELTSMLEEADSAEDMEAFLEKLMNLMEKAGESLAEVETALTDIAKTIVSSEENVDTKDSLLLEAALDKIIQVQRQQKAEHVQELPYAQRAEQAAQTEQQQTRLTVVKDNSGIANAQADAKSGENQQSMKDTFQNMLKEDGQKLTPEMKEKIAEIVSRENTQNIKPEFNTHQIEQHLEAKADVSEKIIRTEIKVESPRDIMKFAELIEVAKGQKVNKLNIQLHPQELGRVNIELTEHAGKISGRIVFESETARNLFTANAEGLRQQLTDKGIAVDNLEFLFEESEHHDFAGWEGREGRKNGGAGRGGASVLTDSNEDEHKDNDSVYA